MIKRLSFILLLTCTMLMTFAGGSTKKYLKMLPMGRGMLYFVKPIDMNSSAKNIAVNTDFTYPFFKDSVQPYMTMNFTVSMDSGIYKFKRVALKQGGVETYSTDTTERFFSEPVGKTWTNRYSVNIKLTDMLNLFKNATGTTIDLYFDDKKVSISIPKKVRKTYSLIATTIEIGCQGGY
ncbi:MAG: hypothetical protein U0V74_03380 [Chitinophagales bacterium]